MIVRITKIPFTNDLTKRTILYHWSWNSQLRVEDARCFLKEHQALAPRAWKKTLVASDQVREIRRIASSGWKKYLASSATSLAYYHEVLLSAIWELWKKSAALNRGSPQSALGTYTVRCWRSSGFPSVSRKPLCVLLHSLGANAWCSLSMHPRHFAKSSTSFLI